MDDPAQRDDEPVSLILLEELSDEAFDGLRFGAILIDDDGVTLRYNAVEAQLARREADDVVGQNFFTDVAPCTNIGCFRGVLDRMRRTGTVTRSFKFHFPFSWGERHVRIGLLLRLPVGRGGAWIVVSPITAAARA